MTQTATNREAARQTDGKFGAQVHSEAADVELTAAPDFDRCPECQTPEDDFNEKSGQCDDCHSNSHCSQCDEIYDGAGDGYDGMCGDCADQAFPADDEDEDDDTVCVFERGDTSIQIDHRGGENYSLYDENTNEHLVDFQYAGDPEDHSELEDEAMRELDKQLGPVRDLSWWDEEGQAFPASLYKAGLDGTLEPYNGDYPVKDGALRYWREDMTRELLIGEREDGTTIVAVEADIQEGINITVAVGIDPTPEQINNAIGIVQEKASHLPPAEED